MEKSFTSKEIWDNWKAPETLEECVKLFFEILDTQEVSDAGREFKPTYISSCRIWDTHRLSKLLPRMKNLASLCQDEGCPHAGTDHVCLDKDEALAKTLALDDPEVVSYTIDSIKKRVDQELITPGAGQRLIAEVFREAQRQQMKKWGL